jgi:hypothetical protein
VNDAYNVGLSLFVETRQARTTHDGSYVRYGIRRMTGTAGDTSTNKGALISMIAPWMRNGDKGNNATYSLAMSRCSAYFAGTQAYSGFGKTKVERRRKRCTMTGNPRKSARAAARCR